MFLFGKKLDKQCVEENCNDEFIDIKNKVELEGRSGKPPNLREIGAATWLYLHNMANKYPEDPNSSDKERYKNWIYHFSNLYPCKVCRNGMKKILENNPPSLNDRKDFVLWLCEFHNKVNQELGAKTYKCNYQDLLKKFNN
ncbi:uncharacterized protein cubi_02516 [Cryptosporidium ubiquitum]|uniref:Sulfhydryl oxidase n=1 Tax=Cryptosporidium ubiquitum TaxID=857276 RepID=A0A1J4MJU0_9CRYT|nr:uncharacterized protein cubi_02516 [Cryptosporidium ubiquitum]OII73284.1 hypothetical protein cubi_02516 [Cryptosporidium ubiquitum]